MHHWTMRTACATLHVTYGWQVLEWNGDAFQMKEEKNKNCEHFQPWFTLK